MTTPAGDDLAGSASIRIVLDDTAVDASAQRLGDRIERILDRASRDAGRRMQRNIQRAIRAISPAQIRVEADLRPFGHSIDTLNNFDAIQIRVEPDLTDFAERIRTALANNEFPVTVVPDFDRLDAAIRAHNAPAVNVAVNADTSSLSRLDGVLGSLGRGLGAVGGAARSALSIGAVGIAAAGAAQSVFALTAALAPAAGLLAAGPAVVLGYQAALGSLRLALSGVGEAFGAALTGSAKEFNKSLEELSPAAQAAAREVRALKPAFEELRTSVQDAFFQQIEGQITDTANALRGPLLAGLTNISAAWGVAASEVLGYVSSTEGVGAVESILKGTETALAGLAPAARDVTQGFLTIGAAVSDAFGERLSAGIESAGAKLGAFLFDAADSGRAVEWVDQAITALGQLASILGNVGSIISGVFEAGSNVGAGFLANLETITQSFSEFVNSDPGQTAIGNVLSTLGTIASQLGPILGALVTQVGAIAPALAPLFTAIGPAITSVINALGPAIQGILPGVQALVSGLADGLGQIASSGALTALGTALGQVGTALAPLLPLLGQLVASVGTALAPVVSALATALAPVVAAIAGALTPILPPLTAAFTTLAAALTPLITLIGTTLAEVITAVAPAFGTIAQVIAQVATAIAPLIAQVTTALVPAFQMLAPLIAQNVAAFTPLIEQLVNALLPALPPIIDAFTAIFTALLPIVPVLAQLSTALIPIVSNLIAIIGPAIQFGAEIIKWVAINAVVPVITRLVAVISTIVGAVTGVITSVSGFQARMIGIFNSVRSSVTSTVLGLVGSVVGFFQSLSTRAVSAVAGIVGALAGVFNSARSAVLSRIASLVSGAVSALAALIGRARSALSGAGGALVSAGADLIRGFISGIRSMAGALVSAATGVVQGAVDSAKSLLGISSPSKVFRQIGRDTGQGFINGLTGSVDGIKQAADKMAKAITDAFKGKKTRLDDVLVARLRLTQKELQRLAKQRDAIAERIKKANEFAAQTTQSALQAFSLQSIAQERGTGVGALADGLGAAVDRIRKFTSQVNNLARRGLNRNLLQQIIGLGPEQGAALASSLASASAAQLADLNEAQRQLDKAAKDLGKDSADALFDAGRNAGRGFLEGLKGQQKQIERVMTDIARSLARAIRRELGIRSPSRVFARIGEQTMQGLRLGVDDQVPAVARSAVRAANVLTDPFGAGVAAPRIGGRFGAAGAAGTSPGGAVTNNTTSTRTISPVFNISSPVNGEALAQQIINRLAVAGVGL